MQLVTTSRNVPILLAVLIALWLAPGSSAAPKDTGMKFDRKADFSKYRTYGWQSETRKPEGSPLAVGGAIDTKIRNAVTEQLRLRGFEPAIDAEPDFLVSFDGAMEAVTDFDGLRRDVTPGVAWVMEGSFSSFSRGTLVISVTDAASGRKVWSAWTTEKVKDPENPDKQIGKAVRKLLKRFPPQ